MQKAVLARVVRTALAGGAVLTLMGASGCPTKDATSPEESSAAGAYTLASVDQSGTGCVLASSVEGCTIQNTGESTVVLEGGEMVLTPSGSFTLSVSGTKDGAAQDLGQIAGTWTEAGSVVNFTTPLVPLPIPAQWVTTTSGARQLVFTVPAQIFSAEHGTVMVVFDRAD